MILPGLISRIAADAAFRAQFLADPAAAVAAQQIALKEEEWAALLSVQQFLTRADADRPVHKVVDSDKWIGGRALTHAGLSEAV